MLKQFLTFDGFKNMVGLDTLLYSAFFGSVVPNFQRLLTDQASVSNPLDFQKRRRIIRS
jgi:hypothetical protein